VLPALCERQEFSDEKINKKPVNKKAGTRFFRFFEPTPVSSAFRELR
jgi:hypothetical protein